MKKTRKKVGFFFGIISLVLACIYANGCVQSSTDPVTLDKELNQILCTSDGCSGTYVGPEFINGDDIAHQFSNSMSGEVGAKLKALYNEKLFVKVDFSRIEMTTAGMGTGTVEYFLFIPFEHVEEACDAFTSFDHSGGWNHSPALESRKEHLQKALLAGESLDISELITTKEGLQEYWIQWKNKVVQAECAH